MMQFDSTDVEVEKASDAVFDTLAAHEKLEIVCVGADLSFYADLHTDVRAALEMRCRAWYAANTPEEKT